MGGTLLTRAGAGEAEAATDDNGETVRVVVMMHTRRRLRWNCGLQRQTNKCKIPVFARIKEPAVAAAKKPAHVEAAPICHGMSWV